MYTRHHSDPALHRTLLVLLSQGEPAPAPDSVADPQHTRCGPRHGGYLGQGGPVSRLHPPFCCRACCEGSSARATRWRSPHRRGLTASRRACSCSAGCGKFPERKSETEEWPPKEHISLVSDRWPAAVSWDSVSRLGRLSCFQDLCGMHALRACWLCEPRTAWPAGAALAHAVRSTTAHADRCSWRNPSGP